MRVEKRIDKPTPPIRVAILGSTGSIGTQTLDIARMHPERIDIVAITAGANVGLLEEQAAEFSPECVSIGAKGGAASLSNHFSCPVFDGSDGLVRAATWLNLDVVVVALVGAVGLKPTIAAVKTGSRIALANKETLVVAGDLIQELASQHGAEIIPVDSEHSAIYQCLLGEREEFVSRLILTASGGPFRKRSLESFGSITREEAMAHPNWEMGSKITIDSATMMNKGLEVIEARWLFDLPPEKIDVVIHPQSIVHSMVEFVDGSSKAQLGPPDMKVPIQFALSYPERWKSDHEVLDWSETRSLDFEAPDLRKYPSLGLAFEALRQGGAVPAILNAANEIAVDRFLKGDLEFIAITRLVEEVLSQVTDSFEDSFEDRVRADQVARKIAKELGAPTSH